VPGYLVLVRTDPCIRKSAQLSRKAYGVAPFEGLSHSYAPLEASAVSWWGGVEPRPLLCGQGCTDVPPDGPVRASGQPLSDQEGHIYRQGSEPSVQTACQDFEGSRRTKQKGPPARFSYCGAVQNGTRFRSLDSRCFVPACSVQFSSGRQCGPKYGLFPRLSCRQTRVGPASPRDYR